MPSDRYDLFPTSRAIPESLQIGRKNFIDRVEGAVTHGANVLLLEERRTGKSSVAKAVIERLRTTSPATNIGLLEDLSDRAVSSSALARSLRKQSTEQDALRASVGARLAAQGTIDAASGWFNRKAGAVGKAAGTLGDDEAAITKAIGELLPESKQDSLRAVLEALDAQARANGIRVVIFIDEIQKLATWPDATEVKDAISTVSGREGAHLNFIFAGSERSAIDAMFGEHDPLDFFGDRLDLPTITDDEWIRGLTPRFQEAKLTIASEQIVQIVLETEGHPGRTIHICRQILSIVPGDGVTAAIVKQAIAQHRNDPAWKRRRA